MSLPLGVFLTGGRRGWTSSSSSSLISSIRGTRRWAADGGAGGGATAATGRGRVFEARAAAAGSVRERPRRVPQPGQKLASPGSLVPQLWQNCGASAGTSGTVAFRTTGRSSDSVSRVASGRGRRTGSEILLFAGWTMVCRNGCTGEFIAARTAVWLSGFLTGCISPLTGAGTPRTTGTLR